MSARTAVLDTYELLEHILLRLPLRDLFLAESVCKAWRHLILSSTPIRRALFRQTDERLDVVGRRVYSTSDAPARVEWTDTTTGATHEHPMLNPWMHMVFTREHDGLKVLPALVFRDDENVGPGWAFYHRSASWRDMLPRQPAQSSYTISCMLPGAGVNTVRAAGAPVTLGQLSDGLGKHVLNCKKCDGPDARYHVTGLASAREMVDLTITGWQVLQMTGL